MRGAGFCPPPPPPVCGVGAAAVPGGPGRGEVLQHSSDGWWRAGLWRVGPGVACASDCVVPLNNGCSFSRQISS